MGFSPWLAPFAGAKAQYFLCRSAWLKPCPDTKPVAAPEDTLIFHALRVAEGHAWFICVYLWPNLFFGILL
jgi:hypothetical protein